MTVALHCEKSSRMPTAQEQLPKTCCFWIPLRVGCFILGYLSLIVNAYRLLNILVLTVMVGYVTNGFQENGTIRADSTDDDGAVMIIVGIILLFVFLVNLVWLGVNIAALVGMHKRRPGPIRVYVAFATIRLLVSIGEFIFITISRSGSIDPLVFIGNVFELSLCAYFICVYYTYSAQLEKELKEEANGTNQTQPPHEFTNEISFIYPTNIDKEILIPPKGIA